MSFFLLTYLSGVLASPAGSVVQAPSNDLYSESPCELRSLSAFKDIQGNVWGIGDGNLWWFNATNLSWSLLPLPNGSTPSEPWRVSCVDPRKYVAIVGRNASLVLHLPWQHWQFGDTDDVRDGYVDGDATWCVRGVLYATDATRETLYVLDVEEARWTVQEDLIADSNRSNNHGIVSAWVWVEDELVLVEDNGHHEHITYTNASGIGWVVVAENNNKTSLWPDLKEGRSLAWSLDSERLWLWKETGEVKELWVFTLNSSTWTRVRSKQLPPLENVLTGWTDGDRYCALQRSTECTSQYSISSTLCWTESEMMVAEDDETPPPTSQSTSTTSVTTTAGHPTTAVPSAPPPPVIPLRLRPSVAARRRDGWKTSPDEEAVAISPSRGASDWHQHTSVFGSVIFFGTSITIFAIFGMFWCVRRCVHFPKEALLLRDPPSVRYTAIPDSLGYDSRRATPATYTVIPDSMA